MNTPITQSDLDELYQAARLFTFPAFCKQATLFKIHAHLTAQLAEHTLTPLERITHASNYTGSQYPPDWGEAYPFANWLREYDHLNDDDIQSDQ